MEVETIKIEALVLDPNNARKHSQRNLDAIKGSLAKFGQQKPIVVNNANVVVAGNGTLQAAQSLGWKEIRAVRTELEGVNAIAFALADNKTGELAEWDDPVLKSTIDALLNEGFEIEEIGFSHEDIFGKEPAEPKVDNNDEFLIVIECDNEIDQAQIYEELQSRNIKCKIM